MILCHIVAASKNRVIGKGNDLPWHIPEDFQYFKDKTRGHPVIMGRLTYESINKKPLPDRVNIIVSRSLKEAPGFLVFPTIEEAVEAAANLTSEDSDEVFIIGGGEIYKQSMEMVDRIYYTDIDMQVEDGEVFYPEIPDSFQLVKESPCEGFTFQVYQKTDFKK
tara:strand:- start:3393 stop:3884 length:492 start_codon:yes stop_codon:yes gene_type:complete